MIGAPARQKGALRHRERQLPVRHTFSLSQRTLLFSRCSLGHGRGPRARGRCSVTHAPSFLRITYLYLELVRARRVTRDQTDYRSIVAYARFSSPCARAHASKNATERRLKEGPALSWLFDRLHACRANPLHARSRVFRMVSDTPVLRFLPLPVEIFQLIDIRNSKGGGGIFGTGQYFDDNFNEIKFEWGCNIRFVVSFWV